MTCIMGNKTINLEDQLQSQDKLVASRDVSKTAPTFRTRVQGGYGYLGQSELGEVLFEEKAFDESNQIVIGGALFVLEKVFGIQSPLAIDYLNNIMSIANTGAPITEIYPKENTVCLFGVGIGGSGDTINTVHDVKFIEREIMNMIPLRLTATALDVGDVGKYWFRKLESSAKTSYYLKRFETTAVIKALWADGEGDEDGTEVEANVHTSVRTEPIETFVEMILKITKKDCREFFEDAGNIEQSRINSIGLFTGVLGTLADTSSDYKQVKLFSKLNINNEMLTTAKDLTIVYRIYTS
jgi:hypothetical protein